MTKTRASPATRTSVCETAEDRVLRRQAGHEGDESPPCRNRAHGIMFPPEGVFVGNVSEAEIESLSSVALAKVDALRRGS